MAEKKTLPTRNTETKSNFTVIRESPSTQTAEKSQEISKETILNSITDGVFTIDKNWIITSFNRAAEEITGISNRDAIGQRCSKVFCSLICGKNCPMEKTFATKIPMNNIYTEIVTRQNCNIPVNVSTSLLRDSHNKIIGGAETFQDLRLGIKLPFTRNYTHKETSRLDSLRMEVAIHAVETQTIIAALRKNNFNRQAAARELGIHKSTFFRKIKSLGIILPQIDGRFRLSNNNSQ